MFKIETIHKNIEAVDFVSVLFVLMNTISTIINNCDSNFINTYLYVLLLFAINNIKVILQIYFNDINQS